MIVFLDACIFSYAAGKEHKYKNPCQEILMAVRKKKIFAYTDTEVMQEILYRGFYKNETGKAISVVANAMEILDEDSIFPVCFRDITLTSQLMSQYRKIEPRDAVHLAVMRNNNIDLFCTADQELGNTEEITAIDPVDLAKKLRKEKERKK